jgi:hypothetical protein
MCALALWRRFFETLRRHRSPAHREQLLAQVVATMAT